MKNKTLSLCLVAMMLSFGMVMQAQITGTVLEDGTGEPVIGASILQVGTTNGVITDFDGNFEINVPEGAELQFSYMGFASQTVAAKKGMVIRLKEDNLVLQEVVAIGYGSQKKKEVTGSVASVKAEDFNSGVKSNPVGLIQGKVAGLNISKSSADPTSTGYNIQIRGFSTLDKGAGTSPLYIVDGIPTDNIDNISPDEIATMDVLKDGSAAAIYGTRGTNGVILITTKRGDGFADQPVTNVEYSGYVSLGYKNTNLGIATPQEFRNLYELSDGHVRPSIKSGAGKDYPEENNNYIDMVTRNVAVTHSHNVAITGSHKKFNYRASVNYKKAEGIAKFNSREEIIAKLAANQKALNGWLELQYDASYMHYRNNYCQVSFKNAAIVNPTYPVHDAAQPSGFFKIDETGQTNPIEQLNDPSRGRDAYKDGNFFRGSIKATVNIKAVEGLKVSAFAAIEEGDNRNYWSNGVMNDVAASGQSGRDMDNSLRQLYEATADYVGSWGKHNLVGVLGFSYQHYMSDGESMSNQGFPTPMYMYYSIGDGDASKEKLNVSSGRSANTLAGCFLRVNYNYDEKYLLSASVRYEGSSRFGANHKWGWFPAVSAGWRIKGEDFMKDQDWCNDLKLRLGFGVTGNNLAEDLRSMPIMTSGGTYWDGATGKWVGTYSVARNENPDLQWEKKFEYNLGIDFMFLNSRLGGSLDAYFRQTRDLLWEYDVPTPPRQYPTLLANAGIMNSYGVELALTGVPVQTKHWEWTSTLTLAWNQNKIMKLSNEALGFNYTQTLAGQVGENGVQNTYTQILVEGGSVGAFYGQKIAIGGESGLDNAAENFYYGQPMIQNGVIYYRLASGGVSQAPSDGDRTIIGSAQPAITFGWNNTIKWKDLDITLFFRGVAGNKILNLTRWAYGAETSTSLNVFMYDIKNHPNGIYNTDKRFFSNRYLEDGSYLKLDNITVGYTFRFKDNKYINSLRLYGTLQNVFTITAYSGQDPEVNTSSVWSPGIDYADFYPRTGSFQLGVHLNLF